MSEPLHILLVEDDEIASERITELITPLLMAFPGSRVTPVKSRREAEKIIADTPAPDVVLLDLGLPDSMIDHTIAQIAAIEERSPVVIVTGATRDRVERVLRGYPAEIAEKDIVFRQPGLLVQAVARRLVGWRLRKLQGMEETLRRLKQLSEHAA